MSGGSGTHAEAAIRLALGRDPDTRVFRNMVGAGWQGRVVGKTLDTITLGNARHMHFGLAPGSADLIAIRRVVISPDMVGQTIGVFGSIEVKSGGGKAEADQTKWRDMMRAFGARAGVARTPGDASAILDGEDVG